PRVLGQMEYKALRDSSRKNIRLYTMIELLLQTGIRIGELSRLKLEDTLLSSNPKYISIGEYASNSSRKVELNSTALQALGNYLIIRNSPKKTESKHLFHTKSGKPVLVRNIRSSINKAFRKAGIEKATVNDIRNTFIVFQLTQGMRSDRVADVVGHQRVSSTEKYLEIVKNRKKRAITKIEPL
ncbi:MAG TPA: site-specific integrase, partial [bacterium]|nr:site-specific integrase [bacterium]